MADDLDNSFQERRNQHKKVLRKIKYHQNAKSLTNMPQIPFQQLEEKSLQLFYPQKQQNFMQIQENQEHQNYNEKNNKEHNKLKEVQNQYYSLYQLNNTNILQNMENQKNDDDINKCIDIKQIQSQNEHLIEQFSTIKRFNSVDINQNKNQPNLNQNMNKNISNLNNNDNNLNINSNQSIGQSSLNSIDISKISGTLRNQSNSSKNSNISQNPVCSQQENQEKQLNQKYHQNQLNQCQFETRNKILVQQQITLKQTNYQNLRDYLKITNNNDCDLIISPQFVSKTNKEQNNRNSLEIINNTYKQNQSNDCLQTDQQRSENLIINQFTNKNNNVDQNYAENNQQFSKMNNSDNCNSNKNNKNGVILQDQEEIQYLITRKSHKSQSPYQNNHSNKNQLNNTNNNIIKNQMRNYSQQYSQQKSKDFLSFKQFKNALKNDKKIINQVESNRFKQPKNKIEKQMHSLVQDLIRN
ncbi:hypothetical protein PPERSA_02555 [Pseudocohnilembus persalinus]|uniref:Uncharacterized protein n=1 Tax=Pseudocohnilembus persalinus TaxID=266149 RepID=A0A0V0R5C5_PSEPJ|nr:hypothetical protein PPERSA_02555 [Pseudocohnilembus persalinus]|eukprot:KRX09683.1 hypothetical protein PPERSA_02555 [Pseudocohnilembus persalinus]